MSVELKAGLISDFFASAKETAQGIDEGRKVTKKNIIWVEPVASKVFGVQWRAKPKGVGYQIRSTP